MRQYTEHLPVLVTPAMKAQLNRFLERCAASDPDQAISRGDVIRAALRYFFTNANDEDLVKYLLTR
jgi:hypothetical protein